jgi:hypothetical protein
VVTAKHSLPLFLLNGLEDLASVLSAGLFSPFRNDHKQTGNHQVSVCTVVYNGVENLTKISIIRHRHNQWDSDLLYIITFEYQLKQYDCNLLRHSH